MQNGGANIDNRSYNIISCNNNAINDIQYAYKQKNR